MPFSAEGLTLAVWPMLSQTSSTNYTKNTVPWKLQKQYYYNNNNNAFI